MDTADKEQEEKKKLYKLHDETCVDLHGMVYAYRKFCFNQINFHV